MVRDWAVRGDVDNVWLMEMSGVTSTNLKDLGKVITEREELRDGLGAKEEKRGGEWVSASVPPPLPPQPTLRRSGLVSMHSLRHVSRKSLCSRRMSSMVVTWERERR